VNRVVDKGQARSSAIALAEQIAAFPEVCMREDRLSMYEGIGLALPDALGVEFAHGATSVRAEMATAVSRFVGGAGRHGSFDG
jgi:enoyl-CoA hydratase